MLVSNAVHATTDASNTNNLELLQLLQRALLDLQAKRLTRRTQGADADKRAKSGTPDFTLPFGIRALSPTVAPTLLARDSAECVAETSGNTKRAFALSESTATATLETATIPVPEPAAPGISERKHLAQTLALRSAQCVVLFWAFYGVVTAILRATGQH